MHTPNKFQWDDLQHLLAVARHGSRLAAGRALGVDPSTVQRRVTELERCIGQSLVQRHPTGYRLTAFGQEMMPFAESVESAALAFERQIATLAGETAGVIRMTCPEPIVNRITQTGLFDRFHAQHPARVEDLAGHALVGFDGIMAQHRLSTWLRGVAPNAELASRSSSVLGLIYSVKAGLGVGALPIPLGDAEPDLVRLFGPVPELSRIWRMLTTPELRRTPRVSAFFDFIIEENETLRPILSG
jgi:DNA-binding transcriptional LysR family regulator